MGDLILRENLSETSVPLNLVLRGYEDYGETESVRVDVYWRWEDDDTMEPQFLAAGVAGQTIVTPFDPKGRDIRLFQVAQTSRATKSDRSVKEGEQLAVDMSASRVVAGFSTQSANTVFAGPTTGSPAIPAFRALVAADIPNLDASKITTGTLAVARGGTGITSLGAGVATWLGTPSSANLAAAITDETGSGLLVFATSPTFTTSIDINSGGAYKLAGANVIRTPGTNFYFGTGGNTSTNPTNNLIFGSSGGSLTTGGSYNVLIGVPAAADITTGTDNLCIGVFAGWKITSGASNVFMGSGAGSANTIASFNTCLGREAMDAMVTSQYNVAIGRRAGRSVNTNVSPSTADGLNVFIGANCSTSGITTGVKNVLIGAQVNAPSNVSNNIIIGDGDGTHRINVDSSGRVGFGTGVTISARCHALSTTEQLRLGYDTSNYFSVTVNSTGNATLDLVASSGTPAFTFSDPVTFSENITIANAKNIVLNTSTGTKIGTATGQKLSFWNKTPVTQPDTSTGMAAFVANSGTAVNTASTFDGYTLDQIVNALRLIGILA